VLVPAREAFSGAVGVVAGVAALLLVGVAALAITTLRHVPRTGAAVAEPVPAAA
jgi:DHA2 family multidrug resistance protein-like MFS transporter